MAIYRCNSCGHLLELPNDSVGASLPCPRCARPNTAYDTTVFVRKVVEKYFALRQSRRARNPTRRRGAVSAVMGFGGYG